MSGGGVAVDGGESLRGGLAAARRDLERMRDTHAAIARLIAGRAAAAAPRRSGRLAAGIAASANDHSSIIGAAGVAYAGVVHWGWPARHIAGDPFITRAAQACEPQWTDLYRDGLQTVLDDAARTT
jgi:phage gpG-like protein